MQNNFLKNKKIILSAGASGIGLATVKLLLLQGAIVYTCDIDKKNINKLKKNCLLYTSPSPRDTVTSRMPSSA